MKNKAKKDKVGAPFVARLFWSLVLVVLIGMLGWYISASARGETSIAFTKGLDIAGGAQLTYIADTSGVSESDIPTLMGVLRSVIERRVNAFGVSEPQVYTETGSVVSDAPKYRLIVELPEVTDIQEAVRQIGETPHLEFKLMQPGIPALTMMTESGEDLTTESTDAEYTVTGLTGRYVTNAELSFGNGSGISNEPVVLIAFDSEGGNLFSQITSNNIGKQLAIFLDGERISAPRINEAIIGGTAVISGDFTLDEAKSLVDNLNFGSLPLPIELAQTQIVDGSLGNEVLIDGVYAVVIGLAIIALFLLFWYRVTGFISALALTVYGVMMLGVILYVPVTITAAGIAGFLLSLGMAIDANILIFERFKEEYRDGVSSHTALRTAFQRAIPAIRDGNLTTFFAAIVLYWFGTSFVQGFAFMLGIGIVVSLVSALIVTRLFASLIPECNIRDTGICARLIGIGLHK